MSATRTTRRRPVEEPKRPTLDRLFEGFVLLSIAIAIGVPALAYALPGLVALAAAAAGGLVIGALLGHSDGLLTMPYLGPTVAALIVLAVVVGLPLAALVSTGLLAQLVVALAGLMVGFIAANREVTATDGPVGVVRALLDSGR